MKYFLTSYPIDEEKGIFFEKNSFRSRFLSSVGKMADVLFVASDPDDAESTSHYANHFKNILEKEGVAVRSLFFLDNRNKTRAAFLFKKCSLVVLAGGHTPTQNKFFSSFPLSMLLSSFKGTLLGISAGSMNSGREVYLVPEEDGETRSKECNRLAKGLGLTELIIIPHYTEAEDYQLDGLNLYRDVVYPFFSSRAVFCLVDGSYVYSSDDGERIAGECWSIMGGKRNRISADGEEVYVEKERH